MAQRILPKRRFDTGAPTTSDLIEGEIAINTADQILYIRDGDDNIVEIGGGGTASGATTEITQSSHGLAIKEGIRHNGSAWVKAQADSAATLALGVVTEVADSNTFTVAQSGRFTLTSHGLTVGQWYYLSASSAGALTATEPTISQPIVYVESANVIFVFPYRPTNLLVNGGASVVPGDDTVSTVKIQDDAVTADKLANAINTDIAAALPKAGGAMTGAITTNSTFDGRDVGTDGTKLDGIAASANNYVHPNHSGEVTSTADGATVIADNIVDETNLKISNAGSNGQYLQKQSGDTGGLTWADAGGGSYSAWLVKDADGYTAIDGDQIICNAPTTAFTITLPSGTTVGRTVIISNIGAATVTVGRGGQPINSTASDATLLSNRSTQLVYVTSTIGWKEIP